MLSSIPSPHSGELILGPLHLRMYGLMIALGVIAAVWLARRRWADRGFDPDDISAVATVAVPAGLIGARMWHVATDWNRLYCGPPRCPGSLFWDGFEIWHGGLGIPGGILLGTLVGYVAVRLRKLDVGAALDVAAPALPLAQAIGRVGNWFNQELYGRPTSLPWGLRIDPENRQAGYERYATFHPTFLYELLWNLLVVGVLIRVDRTGKLRSGKLFPLYLIGYFVGRLWVESIRIDTATKVGGLRINLWTALAGIAVGVLWFLAGGFRRSAEPESPMDTPVPTGPDGPSDEVLEDVPES